MWLQSLESCAQPQRACLLHNSKLLYMWLSAKNYVSQNASKINMWNKKSIADWEMCCNYSALLLHILLSLCTAHILDKAFLFFFFFNWLLNYQHGFFSVCFVFIRIMLALLFIPFALFCSMWCATSDFFYQRLSFVLSKSSLFCLHISFSHHPVLLHYNHPLECNTNSPFLVVV